MDQGVIRTGTAVFAALAGAVTFFLLGAWYADRDDEPTVVDDFARIAAPTENASVSPNLTVSGIIEGFEGREVFLAIEESGNRYWVKQEIVPDKAGRWFVTLEGAFGAPDSPRSASILLVSNNDSSLLRDSIAGETFQGGPLPNGTETLDFVVVQCCSVRSS